MDPVMDPVPTGPGPTGHGPLPVTVLVSRTARNRDDAALAGWADRLCRDAAGFSGHLASRVERATADGQASVRIGVTFASAADLLRWERSVARTRRLAEVDALAEGRAVTLSVADLDHWGLTARSPTAPSRLRSAVLIWIALFPPALLLNALLMPTLDDWPVLARTLLLTLVLVPVVVFGTLPLLNRALARSRTPAPRPTSGSG
jgi:uncharacterized protein